MQKEAEVLQHHAQLSTRPHTRHRIRRHIRRHRKQRLTQFAPNSWKKRFEMFFFLRKHPYGGKKHGKRNYCNATPRSASDAAADRLRILHSTRRRIRLRNRRRAQLRTRPMTKRFEMLILLPLRKLPPRKQTRKGSGRHTCLHIRRRTRHLFANNFHVAC